MEKRRLWEKIEGMMVKSSKKCILQFEMTLQGNNSSGVNS